MFHPGCLGNGYDPVFQVSCALGWARQERALVGRLSWTRRSRGSLPTRPPSGRVQGGKRKRGQRSADASQLSRSRPSSRKISQHVRDRVETTTYPTSGLFRENTTRYYPTTQRSMDETTCRRRRRHPKIQYLHQMIQDIE